jgi:hypothetical protein
MFQTWRLSKCGACISERSDLLQRNLDIKRGSCPLILTFSRVLYSVCPQLPDLDREGEVMCTTTRMRSLIAGLALFLFLPLVANAYTLVLRDGRRVEIPNNFEVGASTLTYEAAPGIQIRFNWRRSTSRLPKESNSEKSGSLLARLTKTRVEPVSKVTRQ